MESEKEFKEEINTALKLYKVAAIVIVLLLFIGVFYAIMTREKPQPAKTAPPAPAAEQKNVSEHIAGNITQNASVNVTQNISVNITPNMTKNITQNITQNVSKPQNATLNVTAQNTTTPVNKTPTVNLSWDKLAINFPEQLKKLSSSKANNIYIQILEADGTPVTNEEQFGLTFTVDDHRGIRTDAAPVFENSKWLITLRLASPGNYTLTASITCEGNTGHCRRFYGTGGLEESADFEVI